MIRKQIELSEANIDWFNEHYKGASLSWCLDLLFTEFRKAHTHTPEDYARIGALALKSQIEDKVV